MNSLEAVFRAVVELSWRSSLLILAVLVLRGLLRTHLPARLVFWAWIVVAIRLLIPFAVPTSWSPFNYSRWEQSANSRLMRDSQAEHSFAGGAEMLPVAKSGQTLRSDIPFSPLERPTLAAWFALIWGAGVVALLSAKICAYFRFSRALRRSQPASASLPKNISGLSSFGQIRVEITDVVAAPALHGILRPRLLLPPAFLERLSPREMRLVVLHELAHDRRRDLLAQVLIHAAVIVHWFNPLAWIVARLAREDCELACDEFVLNRLTYLARESYGTTLLKIVTLANRGTPPPLGLGVVESKQQIKRRIQMIVDQPTPVLARTVLGCAFFLLVTGLSLTRETLAQPASPSTGAGLVAATPAVAENAARTGAKITYNPAADGLDSLFANGIVAAVGDKVITVADVRREMKTFIPYLEKEARDQDDFNQRFTRQQNQIIRLLVDRLLLIKEFNQHKVTTGEKQIPAESVDKQIADILAEQFDNDRSKFLEYLRARGLTLKQYRGEIEEDIIFHYMKSQEKKLEPTAKTNTPGDQAHLRIIQLKRVPGDGDAVMLDKANIILARFQNGEAFAALAMEFDESQRRSTGGDWGWQSPKDLRSEFREAVFAMKPGQVTAPILRPEGCFLILVENRR